MVTQKPAASYARVSTLDKGQAPETKLLALRDYAQRRDPVSSRWGWARLRGRVFAIDMERCPRYPQGALRLIATFTERPIMVRILAPYPDSSQAGGWATAGCPGMVRSGQFGLALCFISPMFGVVK